MEFSNAERRQALSSKRYRVSSGGVVHTDQCGDAWRMPVLRTRDILRIQRRGWSAVNSCPACRPDLDWTFGGRS